MEQYSAVLNSAAQRPAEPLADRIRRVIGQHARLPLDVEALAEDDDLYQAGLTSHASVALMLGIENEFDVELPDSMLGRSMFESIGAIARSLRTLQEG